MTRPEVAEAADAVRRFAGVENVLVASDFDGTLAPFVTDPDDARADPAALAALARAATLPGVSAALVSGRELAVLRRLSGFGEGDPVVLIGTHGAQSSRASATSPLTTQQERLLADLTVALERVAAEHPGVRVERKPAAVVLHTRGVPEPTNSAALAAAADVAQAHPGCHPLRGKDVQEIGVLDADKGTALRALAADVGATAILYLGDDVTDERAFAVLDATRGDVPVKVGEGDTAAAYRVPDIPAAVDLLAGFLEARA